MSHAAACRIIPFERAAPVPPPRPPAVRWVGHDLAREVAEHTARLRRFHAQRAEVEALCRRRWEAPRPG